MAFRHIRALVLLVVSILVGLWPVYVFAQNVKTHIPERAYQYLPVVKVESERFIPGIESKGYLAALIEHESCISLKHSRCWSPTSRLKTAREEGAGLGMITRAYKKDGSLRFDKLEEMRTRYKEHLEELSWNSVYQRPDLQIRAVAILTMENWNILSSVMDSYQRLAMADAAYNGGIGGVKSDRRLCGLRKDCDPQIWFGHVENTSNKSRAYLYGKRSAFDINRHHVRDVLLTRLPKYERWYEAQNPILQHD